MVTKETIEKKIEEHGAKLKQINERVRSLQAQDRRIQQTLIQLSDESKVVGGAIMELQDLLKELNNDSAPKDEKILPPMDDTKSSGDAQSGG